MGSVERGRDAITQRGRQHLRSDKLLDDQNPWIVIVAVVERAKHGDFSEARRLVSFFSRREPFALSRVSLLVFADMAPREMLVDLVRALTDSDELVRAWAAEAASLTGELELVPRMLAAWGELEP